MAAAQWKPCPFPGSPATLECATIAVPLDYAKPHGAHTTVTFDRLKARDPAHRVGNLFFDPGGPGGSGTGIVYFESLGANVFSAGVRDRSTSSAWTRAAWDSATRCSAIRAY